MSQQNGIVTIRSPRSVDDTVAKVREVLAARGVKLFTIIDHDSEARAAGIEMHLTKLVIFGNPKAGTPLMLAAPSIALDLPLKLLVSEDANGRVWVSYNAPEFLRARHDLPAALAGTLAAVEAIATAATSG